MHMEAILLRHIALDGRQTDIYIKDGLISGITAAGEAGIPAGDGGVKVMDCTGMTAVPGFVNMHTHSAMSLMMNVAVRFSDFKL